MHKNYVGGKAHTTNPRAIEHSGRDGNSHLFKDSVEGRHKTTHIKFDKIGEGF